jgi:FtsZ-interacting cell division protein ZipA
VETWQLAVIISAIIAIVAWMLWFSFRPTKSEKAKIPAQALSEVAEVEAERIFDDEFREELRNRGRLYFKKIISENAMFLQQDLRLTTSQLSDYMKEGVKRTLQEEFAKYTESITTAKDLAIETIQKTQTAIDQQRQTLEKQLNDEVATEKKRILDNFDKNMATIVNHYIMAAIGTEIDLSNQLDYIFRRLEENKAAILEDIRNGT